MSPSPGSGEGTGKLQTAMAGLGTWRVGVEWVVVMVVDAMLVVTSAHSLLVFLG